MGKGEVGGVKKISVQIEFRGETRDDMGRSVEGIADDGVAEGLHMDTDLMGAAGFNADLDECKGAIRRLDTLKHFDV